MIVIIIIGAYIILANNGTNKNNNTSDINTQPADEKITTNYGFSFILLENWILEEKDNSAVNTVKFGSPAQTFTFILQKDENEIFSSAITVSGFTIDERLSAKNVVNLINDKKLSDKITTGTDKCYSNGGTTTVAGMNAYSYYCDTTDINVCNIATESSISKTIVIKNIGNQNTLMLTLVARNRNELDSLIPDFQKILESISYQQKAED